MAKIPFLTEGEGCVLRWHVIWPEVAIHALKGSFTKNQDAVDRGRGGAAQDLEGQQHRTYFGAPRSPPGNPRGHKIR